jgi:hypothetical protein
MHYTGSHVQGCPGQRLVRPPHRGPWRHPGRGPGAILERPYWSVPGRDGTTLVYGQTYAGRYLLVVAVDEDGQAFVVTARDMTDAEKKTFRRKAR